MSEHSPLKWCKDTNPAFRKMAGTPLRHRKLTPGAALPKARRRGLNRLWWLRAALIWGRRSILRHVWGMDLHPTVELSMRTRLDRTFPKGVHVGAYSYLAFDACVLTHDRTRGLYLHTYVGERCFVGARAIILPGLRVGNGAIIGAGSVVTKDVPDGCAVAGNPARIIRSGLETGHYGRLASADATEASLALRGET